MVKYNYLEHNESDFPHINNVDVYKYDNAFDYGRFDAPQMELQICTVPWDVGEAHVGQRTISGIGNVVYFETKAKRDKWFDDIPDSQCYRFTTKFKELHRSLEIDVPIPYDMCTKHNYLRVKYNKFANDESPIQYEGNDGLREWFWFIREVEFLAPSTTRLHLLDDAFQTWIYDVNISGMVLERGHAPMFQTKASAFLANPIGTNDYLLTEDVNYGEANQVKHVDSQSFYDSTTTYACIATTANPQGTWGSKANGDWQVPASAYYSNEGQPSVYVFACLAGNLNTLLTNITTSYPQFKQTIQAVWFAPSKLVTVGNSFTFANVSCYAVLGGRKSLSLTTLSKSIFGYDAAYADIAKLYTSPYAHIEVTDENGNVDIIKVEDTTGTISISAAMSIAYPFITIDAHLKGVGGTASTNTNVTFVNMMSHTIDIGGTWYETLRSWNVPTFGVVLDPQDEYDYSSYFDRAQAVVDYTAAYDSAVASADTNKSNTDASADMSKANADDVADTEVANTALQTAANSAVTARSNTSANDANSYTKQYNGANGFRSNDVVSQTATSTIAANEQQGTIAATSGAITGAVSGLASGNPAGAIAGLVNGLVGAGATMLSTSVTNGLTATQAGITTQSNSDANVATATKCDNDTANQTSTASDITTINNTYATSATANNAATTKGNATRTQTVTKSNAAATNTTEKANALRTKNAAQSAIDNGIAQAGLNAPSMFGTFANGESALTKPIGLFSHVVTQSRSAIGAAGDEFLRYGYMLDRQWDFDGNWNVGKYFTYWKLKDFWVSNLNVPDLYMDKLRFFLFGGVTIWRDPSYIGNKTVYENFND